MAKVTPILLLASGLAASACSTPRFLIEAENARTNTHIVLAFEETVFNKHRVQEGFNRYVASEYHEHDLSLPEGADGAAAALDQQLRTVLSGSHLLVKRTVAQGDLVAVQALWDPTPGQGRGMARVDMYRLVDSKIVEHWAVQQPIPNAPVDDRTPL
jgi:predicted SnoaL-like aldol condensation-catalyzing enzyme